MSNNTMEDDHIRFILEYLDSNIQYFNDIYKCSCESCITSNTEKINSIIIYIISFYKFIIKNKEIIRINKNYFEQIKKLVINMNKINDKIIKDIVYFNKQKSVSIIYLEEEENSNSNSNNIYVKPFQINTFIKYYPEMDLLF